MKRAHLVTAAAVLVVVSRTATIAAEMAKPAAGSEITSVALPGAPAEGVSLDYLAFDPGRHRVWVPAGGTGNAVVIDTKTQKLSTVEKFPTKEVDWRGTKRLVGLSSATVGDGFVYVGSRADSGVCAVDAKTLERGGCVTIPGSPDGLAYVARTKEVWVTVPRDQTIVILDVSKPASPTLAGSFKLEGDPEGYAVDDVHGLFYTNLEDKDRTVRIDVATRKVTATWLPACGEDGPRGLALEPKGRLLIVACPTQMKVLNAAGDGAVVSQLATGEGVDGIAYVPKYRRLYAAAGRAGTMTMAHLGSKGELQAMGTVTTAKGARNAVADEDGTAYLADGPDGKILIVRVRR